MSAGRALGLLEALDGLYESVVMEPADWDDGRFGEWMDTVLGDGEPLDREAAKIVTRGVRRARRLQRYWSARTDGPSNWRMRVDETLGSSGWRPGLELAEWALGVEPDPDLFDEYAERFRAVNFTPVSLTYEEWLAAR